jgi:hypothetical protein
MSEDLDRSVTKLYEVAQKLGKGACCVWSCLLQQYINRSTGLLLPVLPCTHTRTHTHG